MPRTARPKSETFVYHAILRGVNRQQIFECTEDYRRFVAILAAQTERTVDDYGDMQEPRCFIYAWCLMGNHVHLLIKENTDNVGDVMKRIASSYVYYYNHKYDRVGHLFQERYKSQPVSDWNYFVTLLRYIHQNPLKPHLVERLEDYQWSSWKEYMGIADRSFCSTNVVLERIGIDDLKDLVECPLTEDEERGFIDVEVANKKTFLSDDEIWELLTQLCGATNLSQFQELPRPLQRQVLWEAHDNGAGVRALSRLSGVPYSIVQRATSEDREVFVASSVVREYSPEDEEFLAYCDDGCFELAPEW